MLFDTECTLSQGSGRLSPPENPFVEGFMASLQDPEGETRSTFVPDSRSETGSLVCVERPPRLCPDEGGASERVLFLRCPCPLGAEVMVVEQSERLWRVLHDTYTVCIVPERINHPRARSDWTYRGRAYAAHAGCAMLMEPGEPHVTRKVNMPGSFFVVLMDAAMVGRAAEEQGLRSTPHLSLAQTTSRGGCVLPFPSLPGVGDSTGAADPAVRLPPPDPRGLRRDRAPAAACLSPPRGTTRPRIPARALRLSGEPG